MAEPETGLTMTHEPCGMQHYSTGVFCSMRNACPSFWNFQDVIPILNQPVSTFDDHMGSLINLEPGRTRREYELRVKPRLDPFPLSRREPQVVEWSEAQFTLPKIKILKREKKDKS